MFLNFIFGFVWIGLGIYLIGLRSERSWEERVAGLGLILFGISDFLELYEWPKMWWEVRHLVVMKVGSLLLWLPAATEFLFKRKQRD